MINKKHQAEPREELFSTDSADSAEGGGAHHSPTTGCQHIKRAVDASKLRKLLKTNGLALQCSLCLKSGTTSPSAEALENDDSSSHFEYDNTLWLCLKCGSQLCGRSRNQHALKHYETPHSDLHAISINTRSFEIWCYECDNEVSANSRKNLLECVEMVKKMAQKPAPNVQNIENAILSTWEALGPLVPTNKLDNTAGAEATTMNSNKVIPLAPPMPAHAPSAPGVARRVGDNFGDGSLSGLTNVNIARSRIDQAQELLPRVRGLANLGNTCFFNAVMQCLAQTPYLLEVLKETSESGEEFVLPGGTFRTAEKDVELPPIKGTLSSWGNLTFLLADALDQLQSGGGVFIPSKLFEKLCVKCPQFSGGDQHDAHEVLRQLLESVRSEDLRRYQRVILTRLGYKDQDINDVSEDMRQKCKIYGNQAADRILRPDQVFRGFLVSTLTCRDCYNVSSCHEYFLDLSLPVSVEKPQPPQRRKSSPDNGAEQQLTNNDSYYLAPTSNTPISGQTTSPTKSQLKRENKKARKARRAAKHHNVKEAQKALAAAKGIKSQKADIENGTGANDTNESQTKFENSLNSDGEEATSCGKMQSSSSTSEQSDADVEDNLIDDNSTSSAKPRSCMRKTFSDTNGNSQLLGLSSQTNSNPAEKSDDSPENMDKDSLDEDENDSGIATSPANAGGSFPASSETNSNGGNSDANSGIVSTNSRLVEVGLSEKGASLVRQLSLSATGGAIGGDPDAANTSTTTLVNGDGNDIAVICADRLNQLQLQSSENKKSTAAHMRAKRVRTQSYSDWSTTMAPRYQCENGECSIQSCLNNFTAVELMTGNNKVGCDNCTKLINGSDPKAKTINTNATKQFLISSPPAVLILHLKRFQLGPRCMFRKLTRPVNFQMVLDVAPFCGSKVKNLPNIDRKQKKLLYALYGVVEHTGSMMGGHYTAYVKVRAKLKPDDKRWKFIPQGSKAELDQDDEQRKKLDELLAREKARELRMKKAADDSDDFSCSSNNSTSTESDENDVTIDNVAETAAAASVTESGDEASNVQVPPGKWYFVSDSRVLDASEEEVLQSEAYLLFYERIY